MNLFLKKKVINLALIIVIILVISSLFVKTEITPILEAEKLSVAAMAINKDGSIALTENEYFKKYIITCSSEVKELNYNENNKDIVITINKEDISKTAVNSEGKVDFSEINVKTSNSELLISFKKLNKSENYVHIDKNNKKNIVVLISKKENPYKYKVVLNPGHGGIDKGASYGKIYEKDLTLKISMLMEDYLRYNGCEVIYTRKKDDGLDYKKATSFANEQKSDLFVSIHINSGDSKQYNGVATYYNYPAGFQKQERIKLAQTIQDEIIKNDGWKNMGVIRRTDLYVLNQTKMPSVLIECGYILNDSDRERLLKDEVLNNLAVNISKGVINYLFEKH